MWHVYKPHNRIPECIPVLSVPIRKLQLVHQPFMQLRDRLNITQFDFHNIYACHHSLLGV